MSWDYIYNIMASGSVVGLFLQVVPITCLVGLIYAVYRCIRIKIKRLSVKLSTEIIRWLFVCYLTGLINLTLVPHGLWGYLWFYVRTGYFDGGFAPLFSGSFNFVPTLIKVLSGNLTVGSWVRTMLAGNFLMFIPFGFFLPFVSEKINKRNIWKTAAIIPIVVEVIQPIVGRSFDVDDLILNFAGIIVGYFLATGIKALAERKKSA